MAALTLKQALQAIRGYLQAGGHVRVAVVGEPKGPPQGDSITASVFMRSSEVVFAVMGEVTFLHTVFVRFYRTMTAEPIEDTEYQLGDASMAAILDVLDQMNLAGGFTNPDIGTLYGGAIAGQWGYQTIGQTMYRVVDYAVPLPIEGA